ncbi:hypothetical protein IBX73_08475 [candidate division WOR-3 bacterium]|nr:hypothetical protein [candidate division WOR-3 bacterium]
MALKKWGEVRSMRGNIGGYIGCLLGGLIGFLVVPPNIKVLGLLLGIIVGWAVGHSFDPQKTVIYKDEEQKE